MSADTISSVGGFVISYSWLVALLALGALVIVLGVFRSRRKGNGSRPLHTSFDMELPEAQYTDGSLYTSAAAAELVCLYSRAC